MVESWLTSACWRARSTVKSRRERARSLGSARVAAGVAAAVHLFLLGLDPGPVGVGYRLDRGGQVGPGRRAGPHSRHQRCGLAPGALVALQRVRVAGHQVVALAGLGLDEDRKSTRLNSSHVRISYAVFCLK